MKTTSMTENGTLGEPDAHVMMRHAKVFSRTSLIIVLIATIALFVFYRQAAYLAALPLPILLLALIFVSYLEKQSRVQMLRVRNQKEISSEEVEMNVRYAGIYTIMSLAILFAMSSFIVATTMVSEWSLVGLATAVLFLLSIVIVLPYIPLFVEDARQGERDKLELEATSREEEPPEKDSTPTL